MDKYTYRVYTQRGHIWRDIHTAGGDIYGGTYIHIEDTNTEGHTNRGTYIDDYTYGSTNGGDIYKVKYTHKGTIKGSI